MTDKFMIAIVQKLCQDYNWRFNSSEKQINNGTISIIIKGKVFEISKDCMLRQRRPVKTPEPYINSYNTNANIRQFDTILEAMKYLHNKYGNDVIDTPTYYIKYKYECFKDEDFTIIKAIDFDNAKLKFKKITRHLGIANASAFKKHETKACVMLIEEYGNTKRLVDIRNVFLPLEEVNEAIK